jgi:pimeloyl-ACP methyl ester carboxylesterase
VRLRLHHHPDGARIAYREAGNGPSLILLHSLGLSHREWEPIVAPLSERFRVILPDLPLHGDSEDSPRHPYSREWMTEVLGGFCAAVGGSRAAIGGHGIGGELALQIALDGGLDPSGLVLCPTRLHGRNPRPGLVSGWKLMCRAAAIPGLDRTLAAGAKLAAGPLLRGRLSATGNPDVTDLIRHAFADVGDPARARAWAAFAKAWPKGPERTLLDRYSEIDCRVLLLWADRDPAHPVEIAREALDLIPDAQLRMLDRTGYLPAYDDPVAVAREISAFLR